MADKTAVKIAAGRGRFIRDQGSTQQKDSDKSTEEQKLLKEKLLDEKMKLIRQKNEERLRRQREIEEDIKNASLHSNQVVEEKPAIAAHTMSGVRKDNSPASKTRGRARGRILAKMAKEELQAHKFENKRKQNYKAVEKELQEKTKGSPPIGGSSSFLSDDRRVDMSKVSSRSIHSWGGSQFEDVVEKVNKEHFRPRRTHQQNLELSMTGKERQEYLEWKEERNRIDKERKLRQKKGETWQREWDKSKVQRESNPIHDRLDHKRRSGQRFGERTRQRPDWDLHDDRVTETNQRFHHTSDKQEEKNVCSTEPSDDWEESSNLEQNTLSHDLSEDIKNTEESNEQTNETTALNSENQKDFTTDKNDFTYSQESSLQTVVEAGLNETGKCTDIQNLTVIVDQEGNRNITDESFEFTNKNTNKHCDEIKELINGKDRLGEEGDKQEKTIEQPKPQRVKKKCRQRDEKEIDSVNHQEKNDLTKEMDENDETNSLVLKCDVKIDNKADTTETDSSQDISTTNHTKSKDDLPKLKIKKTDENEETVPDFLKTPQKKNWADCEFDEEFDLQPLEWDSLTKQYVV